MTAFWARVWQWVLQDIQPPTVPPTPAKSGPALGLQPDGTPIYKARPPLQPYDHTKLDDPHERDTMLDHVEEAVEDILDGLIGSGGRREDI